MSRRARCIHRVIIQRNTAAADGAGGATENWQAVHLNTICRVMTPSEYVQMRGGGPVMMGSRMILLPNAQIDVKATDRVLFGAMLLRILSIKNWDYADRFLLLDCETW
jgi:head-tail adaptor